MNKRLFPFTFVFLALLPLLSRCGPYTPTPLPSAPGQLAVEVSPAGAEVTVNGEPAGYTPLVLALEPGSYTVVVRLAGYAPLTETVVLNAAAPATVRGQLAEAPLPPPPTRPGYITATATLAPTSTPQAPLSPLPTPAPPASSLPTPTEMLGQVIQVRESRLTLASYPWAAYLRPAWSEAFRLNYPALDRAAYEASHPQPQPATYRELVVENDWLRLGFLPELGGRLYRLTFKRTGNDELYHNAVLKPSPWGPPEQGGWLAAGGMEWCLPVEEHGYLWAVPWEARVTQGDGEATVLLTAPAGERLRAQVAVTLGGALVEVRPRLENISAEPLAVKFWINALLAPGPAETVSAALRFLLPEGVGQVIVHSRGDEGLPGAGQPMPWPVVDGRDLSRLGNWGHWLGFFAPGPPAGWAAVYDEGTDEGVVRVFPPEVARGVKVFAFGWADPIDPANYTDDGSAYVELHGGLAPTFDDAYTLAPGEVVSWSEWWYPVAGLGGVRYANQHAALNLTVEKGQAHIGVAVPTSQSLAVSLLLDGRLLWEGELFFWAGDLFRDSVRLPADRPERGRLTLQVWNRPGQVLAEYESEFTLR